MKKHRTLLLLIALLVFSSCSRQFSSCSRSVQTGDRSYVIEMYSGGDVVFRDSFSGIVNNSDQSDGIYYYKGDTLIEVSGDYVIKSLK